MSPRIVHRPDRTPLATSAKVSADQLAVKLADERELTVPLAWFDWLVSAGRAQRTDLEIIEDGRGIWWPSLDDRLSVAGLLGLTEEG
jgi:Protein of unknown function (DUF2442)